jgi:HNH endonuclease
MLWGLAAARCAYPGCPRKLVEDSTETDDPTLVGENCHIVAEADDGPRGDRSMPIEDRNRYANLILMCSVHHKIIDDQVATWTVEKLQQSKRDHEAWVEQSLGLDTEKLREDSIYADYIDEWATLAHLSEWHGWSSFVLGLNQPRLRERLNQDLDTLRAWLLSRVWPGRYPTLESAFTNFRRVLQDFHETIQRRLDPEPRDGMNCTRKFYQIEDWDPPRYERLLAAYNFHLDIVSDLMLELTRAANLVCDEIRRHISHAFRIKEGRLVVQRGTDDCVPQYSAEERNLTPPYPGLAEFYDIRANRDWHIGRGRPKAEN